MQVRNKKNSKERKKEVFWREYMESVLIEKKIQNEKNGNARYLAMNVANDNAWYWNF